MPKQQSPIRAIRRRKEWPAWARYVIVSRHATFIGNTLMEYTSYEFTGSNPLCNRGWVIRGKASRIAGKVRG